VRCTSGLQGRFDRKWRPRISGSAAMQITELARSNPRMQVQSSLGPWVDNSCSAMVSIRNAPADIVRGDHDLNDTHGTS
jgi:hypothetical protein